MDQDDGVVKRVKNVHKIIGESPYACTSNGTELHLVNRKGKIYWRKVPYVYKHPSINQLRLRVKFAQSAMEARSKKKSGFLPPAAESVMGSYKDYIRSRSEKNPIKQTIYNYEAEMYFRRILETQRRYKAIIKNLEEMQERL